MYTHDRKVTYSEISSGGYADIAQIADYFQDCSVFQSDMLGVGLDYLAKEQVAWILTSWQIVVGRYPKCGEQIAVSTWPYNFDPIFGYRNFSLEDAQGHRLAVANSQWILVNTQTGHPTRITEDITCHYDMDEKADMQYAPRKIVFKDVQEARDGFIVPRAFIDTNQHMNNAQYIRMALEFVPADFLVRQVRVEYRNAAVMGDRIYPYVLHDGQMVKVVLGDARKKPYAVVEFTGSDNGEKND